MLEGLTPPKPQSYYCKVDILQKGLSDSDRKIFLDAIQNPEWKMKPLAAELRSRGLEISDTTIARHRNKQCTCFRD